MSAAHLVTSLRVALVGPVVWSLAVGAERWAVALFLLAAASDALDGWLARRHGAASELGRWFDHCADILLLTAAYSTLAYAGRVPWIVPLAIAASFAFYVADSLRVSGGASLIGSRIGHFAGVANYAILAGLLTDAAVPMISVPAWLQSYALMSIPLYSAAAVLGRVVGPRRGPE